MRDGRAKALVLVYLVHSHDTLDLSFIRTERQMLLTMGTSSNPSLKQNVSRDATALFFTTPHINEIRPYLEADPRATSRRSKEGRIVAENVIARIADLKRVSTAFIDTQDSPHISEHNAALRRIQQPLWQHEPYAGCFIRFVNDTRSRRQGRITMRSLDDVSTLISSSNAIAQLVVCAIIGIQAQRCNDVYAHGTLLASGEESQIGQSIRQKHTGEITTIAIFPTPEGRIILTRKEGKT